MYVRRPHGEQPCTAINERPTMKPATTEELHARGIGEDRVIGDRIIAGVLVRGIEIMGSKPATLGALIAQNFRPEWCWTWNVEQRPNSRFVGPISGARVCPVKCMPTDADVLVDIERWMSECRALGHLQEDAFE